MTAVCGAPCPHGGTSAARKHARAELGWMGHCNRPVPRLSARCWQHPEQPHSGPPPAEGGAATPHDPS